MSFPSGRGTEDSRTQPRPSGTSSRGDLGLEWVTWNHGLLHAHSYRTRPAPAAGSKLLDALAENAKRTDALNQAATTSGYAKAAETVWTLGRGMEKSTQDTERVARAMAMSGGPLSTITTLRQADGVYLTALSPGLAATVSQQTGRLGADQLLTTAVLRRTYQCSARS